MKPVSPHSHRPAKGIKYLLTDIDDTVTEDGLLPAASLVAIEQLETSWNCGCPGYRAAGWLVRPHCQDVAGARGASAKTVPSIFPTIASSATCGNALPRVSRRGRGQGTAGAFKNADFKSNSGCRCRF